MPLVPSYAYLDCAATTPMRPDAVEALLPFLSGRFGNPSGAHALARDARQALDEARDAVADALGVTAGEIVFTGNGTEADNTAILGAVAHRGGTAVCPAAEHHAVLHAVEHVGGRVIACDVNGAVDLDALSDALADVASGAGSSGPSGVAVVSVMAVNNEVGTINDLAAVARIVRERAPGALLHTDAVQAHTWTDTAALARTVDLLSLSAHKFGGPKGIGLLMVRSGVTVAPLLLGGGQERERRSGTQDVGGIVAMATALTATAAERPVTVERVARRRDRLVDGLLAEVDGCVETVPRDRKIAGSAHVCFEGVESEALLYLLERAGVYASAGSSCSSGAVQISHVLAAMGIDKERAVGAVRFSLGATTTDADVDRALDAVPSAVRQLRG